MPPPEARSNNRTSSSPALRTFMRRLNKQIGEYVYPVKPEKYMSKAHVLSRGIKETEMPESEALTSRAAIAVPGDWYFDHNLATPYRC